MTHPDRAALERRLASINTWLGWEPRAQPVNIAYDVEAALIRDLLARIDQEAAGQKPERRVKARRQKSLYGSQYAARFSREGRRCNDGPETQFPNWSELPRASPSPEMPQGERRKGQRRNFWQDTHRLVPTPPTSGMIEAGTGAYTEFWQTGYTKHSCTDLITKIWNAMDAERVKGMIGDKQGRMDEADDEGRQLAHRILNQRPPPDPVSGVTEAEVEAAHKAYIAEQRKPEIAPVNFPYSDPNRESDDHSLPDLEIFQMTAEEVATSGHYEDELYEICAETCSLASMNNRDRDKAIATLIEQEGITGGWFYWYCFPGCMPDSEAIGPFATRDEALVDARGNGM